jgi:hypothetical protein
VHELPDVVRGGQVYFERVHDPGRHRVRELRYAMPCKFPAVAWGGVLGE